MSIMTLFDTFRTLNRLAKRWPSIHSALESGDVFDLSKEEYEQPYGAFCATETEHQIGEYFTTFGFVLYYVDRLTFDKSNKTEIHSNAVQFFQYMIPACIAALDGDIEFGEVVPFTERFSAECAGAWCRMSFTTPNETLCDIELREDEDA